ncbi:hypothetical protein HPP92_007583 [Vanilla planifolia]|uniref:Uncharacterized protein n=1 Tax=Vanilla planifolia TaxID=51239 RepID=A0A835VBD6_VANPL|nr:hypothetical protein HPP92_007583 [Vanilla planifolia]
MPPLRRSFIIPDTSRGSEQKANTLLKLVEYEEEDEDDLGASSEETCRSNLVRSAGSKPFWAV